MRLLSWLAVHIVKLLIVMLAAAVAGGLLLAFWWCRGDCDVSSWLQVWVDAWGFLLATGTFLAAWVSANRKPDLGVELVVLGEGNEEEEVTSSIGLMLEHGGVDRAEVGVSLINKSEEAARYVRVKIWLEFEGEWPEQLVFGRDAIIAIEGVSPVSGFEVTSAGEMGWNLGGGANVIVSKYDDRVSVASFKIAASATGGGGGKRFVEMWQAGVRSISCRLVVIVVTERQVVERSDAVLVNMVLPPVGVLDGYELLR